MNLPQSLTFETDVAEGAVLNTTSIKSVAQHFLHATIAAKQQKDIQNTKRGAWVGLSEFCKTNHRSSSLRPQSASQLSPPSWVAGEGG